MEVTIRRAAPSDALAAADLWLRARKAAFPAIPRHVHSDEEIRGLYESHVLPRLDLWLAESEAGELVGILVLGGEWVEQLYVEPSLTGRGIGSRLLETAKRERPAGLRLWAFVSNVGAQRFYERHGFVEVLRTDGSENEERAPDIQYAYAPRGADA